jgi:signal transduction histidine kinase
MQTGYKKDLMDNCNGMAKTFWTMRQFDSSINYANKVLETGKAARYLIAQENALQLIADAYKSEKNNDSLARYLELTMTIKDSLFSQQKVMQLQTLTFNEELRQQEEAQQQQELQTKIKFYSTLAASGVFVVIGFLLYRNNRHKQKANNLLQQQKEKIESTLRELKSTQAQLIQSEKMASLGELTAGIAHEIQNPLNFVNNFSEVNDELIEELKIKNEKLKIEDEEIKELISNIGQNLEKINHHGKRADAIVKNMLQHSRISTGKKETTDINALVDEYLRLSYHGMRAKDKSFNAILKTDFDSSIGNLNVVPQDIGRVLINLYNNAFYAVAEKKKMQNESYEPAISVFTRKVDGKVEIHVKDNGTGIPQKVVDKIFQPFFTTKPTGQGTGLGLSLSYDIIKAHSGEIKVEAKEGEGAEFVVQLLV